MSPSTSHTAALPNGPAGRLLWIGWTMHRATDRRTLPKTAVLVNNYSSYRRSPHARGRCRVLLLRLFALQEGVPIVGRRRRHTKACAAQSDCWQCCQWSRDLDQPRPRYPARDRQGAVAGLSAAAQGIGFILGPAASTMRYEIDMSLPLWGVARPDDAAVRAVRRAASTPARQPGLACHHATTESPGTSA